MTVKLVEGFDHISAAAALSAKGWNLISPGGGSSQSFVAGRIAGQALRINESNLASNIAGAQKSLPAALTQFVIGFAFRPSARPNQTTEFMVLPVGGTGTVRIFQDTTGHLVVTNSGGTGVVSTNTLPLNSWTYIEVKIVINGASGSVATQLNGAADIATTTVNFGSSGVDSVYPVGGSWPAGAGISHYAGSNDYDDLYVLDTSASPNNNFLGDVAVETIYPTGVGAHTDWTPDSGSNFARVNEHTTGTFPDDDVSYVTTTTVGNRDSYAFGDLAILSGTVYAVQTVIYARKDNSGLKQLAAVARPVATDRDGATVTLGTSYQHFTELRETNPDTSAAWTISQVNATEFGFKVVT